MKKETFRQQCIRLNKTISENPFTYELKGWEQQAAIDRMMPAHPLVSKKKAYCSHCGSEVGVLTQDECPVCHKKWGKIERVERASHHKEREYLCVMTVMEGLQEYTDLATDDLKAAVVDQIADFFHIGHPSILVRLRRMAVVQQDHYQVDRQGLLQP